MDSWVGSPEVSVLLRFTCKPQCQCSVTLCGLQTAHGLWRRGFCISAAAMHVLVAWPLESGHHMLPCMPRRCSRLAAKGLCAPCWHAFLPKSGPTLSGSWQDTACPLELD